MKALGYVALLLITLTLAFPLSTHGIPQVPANIANERPLLFNLTAFFRPTDPIFYSFEALQPPKPNSTPIVVTVVNNAVFNNSGLTPYNATVYVPPKNYSLILLNVTINESNGAQYDRTIYIYANNVTVFWGSTQELLNSTAWADLTLLENFLRGNVTFKIVLPNYYVPKYNITGIYKVTVKLILYPGNPPPDLPNYVIPLFYNSTFTYPMTILTPGKPNVTQVITLPKGTYNAMLVLYMKGGGLDEFWYASIPAIRNLLVYYDDYLAGVVEPYPVVYTGGINLFWWKPVPSANTLSFHTVQMIPLTPFLALGNRANLTFSITNLVLSSEILQSQDLSWDLSGYILVWNSSNAVVSAKFIKANGYYLDSSPIFGALGTGYTYDEGSKFNLQYETLINFSKGYEIVSYTLGGGVNVHQVFNPVYDYVLLNEIESVSETVTGSHQMSYSSSIDVGLKIPFSAFAAKISSGSVPPINYSYIQNGTFSLRTSFLSNLTVGKITVSYMNLNETVSSVGGFGGVITVINRYGGAVLSELTQNYAVTKKILNAVILANGYTAKENVTLVGVQNSTIHTQGHYAEVSVRVTQSAPTVTNSSLLQDLLYVIEIIIRFFFTS